MPCSLEYVGICSAPTQVRIPCKFYRAQRHLWQQLTLLFQVRSTIWQYIISPSHYLKHPGLRTWTYRHTSFLDSDDAHQTENIFRTRPNLRLLSCLNKEYYKEMAYTTYARNGFGFCSVREIQRFFRDVRPENLLLIKHFTITLTANEYFRFIVQTMPTQTMFSDSIFSNSVDYSHEHDPFYRVFDFLNDVAIRTACSEQSPVHQPVMLKVLLPSVRGLRRDQEEAFPCHLFNCAMLVKAFTSALSPYRSVR